MGSRRLICVAAVFAFILAATSLARAQASGAGLTHSTESARAGSVPRTPWGEPDLSGVWTTDSMRGVPRERPAEFGTRRYLTDEEYAKRVAQDEKTRTTEDNRVGAFRNDVGTRTIRQTSQVIDPPDGKIPLNDEGKRRAANRSRGSFGEGPFNSHEDFTLYDRCITRGAVGSFGPAIYGNGSVIVQAPGVVALSYEMVHDTRIIPLDGRPHIASSTQQYLGDARGRWEGDTLIVETRNFTGKTAIAGVQHTDALRLTERFRRIDGTTLEYEATIEDPNVYTRPWTLALTLVSSPGHMFPYECHEGNLGLRNILSAERAEDRALEEDLQKGIVRKRRSAQNAGDNEQP